MQPEVACSSAPGADHGAMAAPGTAVVIQALALRPAHCLRSALSAPCICDGRNRQKAPRQRTPHQIQPQAACSSTLDTCCGALAALRTAVATWLLVLRLTQCHRDALSASCGPVGRNRWKAPDQHALHRVQPEVACSSAPSTHHRTLTMPGTDAAIRALALWPAHCH